MLSTPLRPTCANGHPPIAMSKNGLRRYGQAWICRECGRGSFTSASARQIPKAAKLARLVIAGKSTAEIAKAMKTSKPKVEQQIAAIAQDAQMRRTDRWPGNGSLPPQLARIGNAGFALIGQGRASGAHRLVDFDESAEALCVRRNIESPAPFTGNWLDKVLGQPDGWTGSDLAEITPRLLVVLARTNGWPLIL